MDEKLKCPDCGNDNQDKIIKKTGLDYDDGGKKFEDSWYECKVCGEMFFDSDFNNKERVR